MANCKPQRRTIVKALNELAAAVRAWQGELDSFDGVLNATRRAEEVLERERLNNRTESSDSEQHTDATPASRNEQNLN